MEWIGEGRQRLATLTSDQRMRLTEFKHKWTQLAFSTEPANRAQAEQGIYLAYRIARLPQPEIVWCGSPLSQALTRAVVVTGAGNDDVRLNTPFWESISSRVGDSVWQSVVESVSTSPAILDDDDAARDEATGIWEILSGIANAAVGYSRTIPKLPEGDWFAGGTRDAFSGDLAPVIDRVYELPRQNVMSGLTDRVDLTVMQEVVSFLGEDIQTGIAPSGTGVRLIRESGLWPFLRDTVCGAVLDPHISTFRRAGRQIGLQEISLLESLWKVMSEENPGVREDLLVSILSSVRERLRNTERFDAITGLLQSLGEGFYTGACQAILRSIWESGYGQHDAAWLGGYEFLGEACGLKEETAPLAGLWQIAANAGWFLPCRKICFVSERQMLVKQDDQRRLHNEQGPALLYPDGLAIYVWHGVRVSKHIIEEPGKITIGEIEAEVNTEVRRVLIERYGTDRYLKDAGAHEIHSDNFGVLYRKDLPDDEPLVIVKVMNGTPEIDGTCKEYFLRVPPTMKTAREAVAWTFALEEKEYQPAEES